MAQQVDVEFSRHRVSLFLEGVKTRFEELKSRDFPNSTPTEIIELIKAILELVDKGLPNADEKLLPLIFSLLTTYQDLLGYLDNAHTEQTPRGLVCILRQLLQQTSKDSTFFASPQAAYNYGIADVQPYIIGPLKNLIASQDLLNLPKIATSPIRLILFPRAERDNILAHAVFGHEIGHIIAAEYLAHEATTATFQTSLKDAIDEAVTRTSVGPSGNRANNPLNTLASRVRIQSRLSEIRKRAMEELISDYVGVLLFGPSALLASYEIFSLDDFDLPPVPREHYPPSRYRLRFMFEALKQEGFVDAINILAGTPGANGSILALKSAFDRVDMLAGGNDDTLALGNDPIIEVAYKWVADSLDLAKQGAQQKLPKQLIYPHALMTAEVPELIRRLALKVPPSELGIYPKTALPAWQSALLAGWAFTLHGKHNSPTGDVSFSMSDYDTVRKLVLRAIEGIDLQQEYAKYIAA
jgi:hypothetical protein